MDSLRNESQMEREGRLLGETTLGREAQELLNGMVGQFIAKKEQELFEAFKNVSPKDHEGLVNIRLQASAISGLRQELTTYVETGIMAQQEWSTGESNEH
jgi:hypothetical protein